MTSCPSSVILSSIFLTVILMSGLWATAALTSYSLLSNPVSGTSASKPLAPEFAALTATTTTTETTAESLSAGVLISDVGNLSQHVILELLRQQSQIQCEDRERQSSSSIGSGSRSDDTSSPKSSDKVCNVTFDGALCWPTTSAGSVAVVPCFEEFKSVRYDTRDNATKVCHENGTWADKSNYESCKAIPEEIEEEEQFEAKAAVIIYYSGYGLSLIALMIALAIFLYFKELRCIRNHIHTNLMVTYVLVDLTWIITASFNASDRLKYASCYTAIFMAYFISTNFLWMFVEGLYLYTLVVKTFSIELVNLHKYYGIGYGIPAVMIAVWAPLKGSFGSMSPGLTCVFQDKNEYDYIVAIPLCLVLGVNIFFLSKIMFVLITKLRSATTAESQQYRKAAKALLVLIPLLGLTYLLVITTPDEKMAKIIVTYLHAVLISTQGFSVAVLYCFMNGEVQHCVYHHFNRWKTVRTLRGGGEYPIAPRAYAFRSTRYGEGMKLYRCRGQRQRGSSVSFSTSSTTGVPVPQTPVVTGMTTTTTMTLMGQQQQQGKKRSIGSDSNVSGRVSRTGGYTVVRRSDDIVY